MDTDTKMIPDVFGPLYQMILLYSDVSCDVTDIVTNKRCL